MTTANFLKWGAEFLYKDTALHTDVDLLIGYTGQSSVPIRGTMTHTSPLMDAAKVKILQERFMFLIDSAALCEAGLQIVRGLEITMDDEVYQVVIDPKGSNYNNDPSQLRKTIICTKKEL